MVLITVLVIKKEKTKFSEVKKLKFAKESEIKLIDTAIAYGDCEEILGKTGFNNFNFISKLPKIPEIVIILIIGCKIM